MTSLQAADPGDPSRIPQARAEYQANGQPAPLISAIIPLYNGGAYIARTLQSVLTQTLPADEIIVVDDGSTDNGPDIVREMALTHPIRLLRKPNGGQSAARNFGVAHARGDLIAFLDHDDLWYPAHLLMLSKPFGAPQPRVLGWTYSNLDRIDQAGLMQNRAFLSELKAVHPKASLVDCLSQDMFILPSASLIDRKAFLAVGGFDESLSGFEDDDLFLRLFQAGYDNIYLDVALSAWRIFPQSASYSPRMAASRRIYARKLLAQFPDDSRLQQYYATNVIAPRFLRQAIAEARQALRLGDRTIIATCLADVAMLREYAANSTGPYAGQREFLISAIIPLYNGAQFIEETLRSVIGQTMPPDEIIVVDDGSTDDGPEIVRRMATIHPIRLLQKSNGGQSSARNHGVAHAHGDLIAFLDHDDIWYPNHLAALLAPFVTARPTSLGWSYSNLDRVDQDGQMEIRSFLSGLGTAHPKTSLFHCLAQDMYILPSASLIDRKAFLSVGGFDESLSGFEDDDLFLRLFRAGYENIYIDAALSRWRIFPDSASYSPRMAKSRRIYAEKLLRQYPDNRRLAQYHTSMMIAPRFFAQMMAEYRKTLSYGTPEEARMALRDVLFIARHLRRRCRVLLRPLLPLLRIRPLARVMLTAARLIAGATRQGGRLIG
jgi:glycosyltransferase involved in cell wall biosynthesis